MSKRDERDGKTLFYEIEHEDMLQIYIREPMYRRGVNIYYGDLDVFNDRFLGEDEEEIPTTIDGRARIRPGSGSIIYLRKGSLETLVHELYHTAHGRATIIADPDGTVFYEEFVAYAVEYMLNIIKRTKLKKKLKW